MKVAVREAVSQGDRDACRDLRRRVFIDEQGVPESDEWDGLDEGALHLLAAEGGRPVGTARVRWPGPGVAKVERVAVAADRRRAGIGRALMVAAEDRARARGAVEAVLGAQVRALPFYVGLGYAAEGPVFDDAGIPHRRMRKVL